MSLAVAEAEALLADSQIVVVQVQFSQVQQFSSLEDYIEVSLMLQYNNR